MQKKFVKAKVKFINNKMSVAVSDETLDRHGEVIPLDTWDLGEFELAPRMLVDHDHRVESIVGKWEKPRFENNQLVMDPVFHDITTLANTVKEMVEQGFLDTVSVGFIPHGPEKDGDRGRNELIEVSWVTVGANPKARVQASLKALEDKGVSDDDKEMIETFAKGDDTEEPNKEEVEVPPEKKPEQQDPPADDVEKDGDTVIVSVEQFKQWTEKNAGETVVLCETQFISKLVEEVEKQKTLNNPNKTKKVGASNQRVMILAMKEAVKSLNLGLHKSKTENEE